MKGRFIYAELEAVPGAERGSMRIMRTTSVSLGATVPFGWVRVDYGVSPVTHYWDADTAKAVAYPASPGMGWVFDFSQRAWVPDLLEQWAITRRERDARLAASDWRILPDSPHCEAERAQWRSYRQALRDITKQPDPLAIVWPHAPE